MPHALHTDTWEADHRETICVCDQPMQKSTIGQAHMILRHDDSRSLNTRAFDCCTNSACTLKCTISIMYNSDERSMLERNSVMTSSRRRQQMKRRWSLSWAHRKSAESTQRMDSTLGTDLSVDHQVIFLCASPATTRPSVTAADGGTPDTDY